jgi:Ca2+-binding EF-hand superfamily protein
MNSHEEVKNRIRAGIDRRNDEFLENYFKRKTQEYETSTLNRQQFTSALEELRVRLNEDDINILFRTMDLNSDGVLDQEEFIKAVRFPSTLEQFISTLPIIQIFTDAMSEETDQESRLRQFSRISEKQVEDICKVIMPFLEKLIKDAVKETKVSFEAMESSASNTKFMVPDEMPSGTVEDFHRGLPARIGKKV